MQSAVLPPVTLLAPPARRAAPLSASSTRVASGPRPDCRSGAGPPQTQADRWLLRSEASAVCPATADVWPHCSAALERRNGRGRPPPDFPEAAASLDSRSLFGER